MLNQSSDLTESRLWTIEKQFYEQICMATYYLAFKCLISAVEWLTGSPRQQGDNNLRISSTPRRIPSATQLLGETPRNDSTPKSKHSTT